MSLTGTNRVAIIPRKRDRDRKANRPVTHLYTQPFPVPKYLSHSSFAPRFFTTPPVSSRLFGESTSESASALFNDMLPLPTCWDNTDRCPLLELSSDGIQATFIGSAKNADEDAGAVRANRYVPRECGVYYFEVTVIGNGHKGYIGVGVSQAGVSLNRLPGWEKHSWAYHLDDGRYFQGKSTGSEFGPTATTGDIVGCGLDYTTLGNENAQSGASIFFTKNGEFLGYAGHGLSGKLYPSIGLRNSHEQVRVNFGAQSFHFDIEAFVLKQKELLMEKINALPINPTYFVKSATFSSALQESEFTPLNSLVRTIPPQENEQIKKTLDALVLDYLYSKGYIDSARGLLSDLTLPFHEDTSYASESRKKLKQFILNGQVDESLDIIHKEYPQLLKLQGPDGGIYFKLKLRQFIELVLSCRSEHNLDHIIDVGRLLEDKYGADPREDVRNSLTAAFSMLIYIEYARDGITLEEQQNRERLAEGLNQAILVAQKLPSTSQLESMIRHTSASIQLLAQNTEAGSMLLPYPVLEVEQRQKTLREFTEDHEMLF